MDSTTMDSTATHSASPVVPIALPLADPGALAAPADRFVYCCTGLARPSPTASLEPMATFTSDCTSTSSTSSTTSSEGGLRSVHNGASTVAEQRRWCWVRGSARTFVRCFLVASGGKTLLNVLLYVLLLRARRHRPRRADSSPAASSWTLAAVVKLGRQLLDVRYGLFLASYSTSFKVLSRLLSISSPPSAPSSALGTASSLPSASSPSLSPAGSLSSGSGVAWTDQSVVMAGGKGNGHREEECMDHAEKGVRAMMPSVSSSSEVAALPGSSRGTGIESVPASPSPSFEVVQEEIELIDATISPSKWRQGAMGAAIGAMSGLSVYWLPKAHRKVLALYSLTRSGEFFARYLASNGLLPAPLASFAPHIDVTLMALSASQILYSYIMERDTLDPTYSSFLIKFGGKDVRVIDSIAPMRRGGRLNRPMFLEWAREQNLRDVMGCLFGLHHNVICDVVHPGSGCISHFISFTYEGFWRAFPMYATLHSITTVVFLLLKLRNFIISRGLHRSVHSQENSNTSCEAAKMNEQYDLLLPEDTCIRASSHVDPLVLISDENSSRATEHRKVGLKLMVSNSLRNICAELRKRARALAVLRFLLSEVLPKLAVNIVRSSLFLGLYCSSGWFGACIAQRLFLMKDVRWFYPWLALPGLASLIEVPARRRELALYCLPKAMESFYTVLKKYDQVPWVLKHIRDGEVAIFSVSSAVTLFCYLNERKSIKPTFLRIMDWLWA